MVRQGLGATRTPGRERQDAGRPVDQGSENSQAVDEHDFPLMDNRNRQALFVGFGATSFVAFHRVQQIKTRGRGMHVMVRLLALTCEHNVVYISILDLKVCIVERRIND